MALDAEGQSNCSPPESGCDLSNSRRRRCELPSSSMGNRDYRALVLRAGGRDGGSVLHLVREDAEASLCGIPRSALGPGHEADDLVCPDCIEWLLKRRAASGRFQRATPG